MTSKAKSHWENIYATKLPSEVSWTQEKPTSSIEFFKSFNLPLDASIIDTGGGESRFVDYLIEKGYTNVSVLDISKNAIERAKKRLGKKAQLVTWIVADINDFQPNTVYEFWHDRAAFHFLTDKEGIEQYAETVAKFANNVVIGTFSVDGPTKCSGLDITQYDEKSMRSLFEQKGFSTIECKRVDHQTPFDTIQNFVFCSFSKTENK